MELGVKNVYFDANKQEPRRWSTIEQPWVYAGAAITALVVYLTLLFEDQAVFQAF